jgi:hypothetical protein
VLIDSSAQRVVRVACISAVVVMGVAVVGVRYLP